MRLASPCQHRVIQVTTHTWRRTPCSTAPAAAFDDLAAASIPGTTRCCTKPVETDGPRREKVHTSQADWTNSGIHRLIFLSVLVEHRTVWAGASRCPHWKTRNERTARIHRVIGCLGHLTNRCNSGVYSSTSGRNVLAPPRGNRLRLWSDRLVVRVHNQARTCHDVSAARPLPDMYTTRPGLAMMCQRLGRSRTCKQVE